MTVDGTEISGVVDFTYEDTSFVIIVDDGSFADTAYFMFYVDKSNQPPVIVDVPDIVQVTSHFDWEYYPTIEDPNDSVFTVTYPEIPSWCEVVNDSLVVGTAPGIYSIEPLTVIAMDSYLADTATFLVEIFVCGNADGSDRVDIGDVVYLIEYIFSFGPPPDPYEIGDADCSGIVDISDVVYLIEYIFSFGPVPCLECPK
jgi:hypothetical protein